MTKKPAKKPAKPKKPKKLGPPFRRLSLRTVEELAAMQCTYEEIAAFFRVSERTIFRRAESDAFRAAIERGRNKGLVSLRRLQYLTAQKGDRTMLVWLGKQWLGQKDKTEIEHSGGVSVVVERLQAARARLAAAT